MNRRETRGPLGVDKEDDDELNGCVFGFWLN